MPGRVFSVVLLTVLVLGCTSLALKADVSGSFGAELVIEPIDCGAFSGSTLPTGSQIPFDCENTIQKADLDTEFNIHWTISGLSLGLHTHTGFAGLEDVITTLHMPLGAIEIMDQCVFAVPFGTSTIIFENAEKTQSHSQSTLTVIPPGAPLFVQKRLTTSLAVSGLKLTNLAVLEDVAFPTPSAPPPVAYTSASQSIRFGDMITMEGQMENGITLCNTLGLSLDPQLTGSIKKHSFSGVVCDNQNLGFAVERMQIEGIPVGSLTATEELEFRFNPDACNGAHISPFLAETDLFFSTSLGALSAVLTTTEISKALFNSASLTFARGGLTITQIFDDKLQPTSTTASLAAVLNPEKDSVSLRATAVFTAASGLTSLSAALSVRRSGVTFTSSTRLSGAGTVQLSNQTFRLQAQMGSVTLGAKMTVIPAWTGVLTIDLSF